MRLSADRNYKEEANRNSWAEKHNNKIEKFIRGFKQQVWAGRRKNQQT